MHWISRIVLPLAGLALVAFVVDRGRSTGSAWRSRRPSAAPCSRAMANSNSHGAGARLGARLPRRRRRRSGGECLREGGVRRSAKHRRRGRLHGCAPQTAGRRRKGAMPACGRLFASTRRAVELDRYGIAAHVLAIRDGCTAEIAPPSPWSKTPARSRPISRRRSSTNMSRAMRRAE